jgi:thiamine-phosphate pyrophosphorylase
MTRPPFTIKRGLYALIDVDTFEQRDIAILPIAQAILSAKPSLVQVRAKRWGARDTLNLLQKLVPIAKAEGVPIFANDRPDLAVLSGCDGVHCGQDDLPLELIRKIAPSLWVGISTHSMEQLRETLTFSPDYVAFGPVYPTLSKAKPDPLVGEAGLQKAVEMAGDTPVVAIGGITMERVEKIRDMGAIPAVIRALFPDRGASVEEIHQRTRWLQEHAGGE